MIEPQASDQLQIAGDFNLILKEGRAKIEVVGIVCIRSAVVSERHGDIGNRISWIDRDRRIHAVEEASLTIVQTALTTEFSSE
jgi:hypothetical protein